MDPATKPMLAEMLGADGKPKVCERVWISSIGCADAEQTGKLTAGFGATNRTKIGPEFTFGLYMQKFTDAPILLIKTSWGGKSLNTDFRPPSAGPYVFNETQLAALQKQGKDVGGDEGGEGKGDGRVLPAHGRARENGARRHQARGARLRCGAGLRTGRLRVVPRLERHGGRRHLSEPRQARRLRCLQHGDGALHPRCAHGPERAEAAVRHRRARRGRADGGVRSRRAALQSDAPQLPRRDGRAGAVAGVQRQRRRRCWRRSIGTAS